jgi:hypothetical protein
VGKHRRISRAPSGPNAVHAAGRTFRARRVGGWGISTVACHACRRGWVGLDSKIGRPPHTSPRAAKRATALVPTPVWSPGRRGRAPLAAAPLSSGMRIFNRTSCEPICDRSRITQSRKPSQARRILSHPKQRLGSGEERRVSVNANTLRHPKRQSKRPKNFLADGRFQRSGLTGRSVEPTALTNTPSKHSQRSRNGVPGSAVHGRAGHAASPHGPPPRSKGRTAPQNLQLRPLAGPKRASERVFRACPDVLSTKTRRRSASIYGEHAPAPNDTKGSSSR